MERRMLVDAGVVDQRVQAPPFAERPRHHALARAVGTDVLVVGDRGAAGGADLLDHAIGAAATLRIDLAAPVVDQHAQPAPREFQRIRPPEAEPRARDDRDATDLFPRMLDRHGVSSQA